VDMPPVKALARACELGLRAYPTRLSGQMGTWGIGTDWDIGTWSKSNSSTSTVNGAATLVETTGSSRYCGRLLWSTLPP
jgi:hypothetical protein